MSEVIEAAVVEEVASPSTAAEVPADLPSDAAPAEGGDNQSAAEAEKTAEIETLIPPKVDPLDISWVPEKFIVKDELGEIDHLATFKKVEEHRSHLEKRLGSGDLPPKTPEEYSFEVPEEFAGLEMNGEKLNAFKAEALAKGISKEQFAWMMGAHVRMVPDLMEGAAKLSASAAREVLSQTWTDARLMEVNIAHAGRAVRGMPQELQDATAELGTNPGFIRAMAYYGAQQREDRSIAAALSPSGGGADIKALESSPAYIDPRHQDHARVSAMVADFYRRTHGEKVI